MLTVAGAAADLSGWTHRFPDYLRSDSPIAAPEAGRILTRSVLRRIIIMRRHPDKALLE